MTFQAHVEQLTPHLHDPSITSALLASPASMEAYALAAANLDPLILNHSVRVFLHAQRLVIAKAVSQPRADLLYAAAILHDLGSSPAACGPQRFEVEGADAAAALLERHGATADEAAAVWRAIALHTSAGIAERMGHPVDTLRHAIVTDFSTKDRLDGGSREYAYQVEQTWPRGEIEACLAAAVVAQAIDLSADDRAKKAPAASWPGTLVQARRMYPNFTGRNPAF